MKFAWLWGLIALVTTSVVAWAGKETLSYSLGQALGALLFGGLVSPIVWLALRPFSKTKWLWFHWLNAICFAGLVLFVLLTALKPWIEANVQQSLANRSGQQGAASEILVPKTAVPPVPQVANPHPHLEQVADAGAALDVAQSAATANPTVVMADAQSQESTYKANFQTNFTVGCSRAMSSGEDAMPFDFSLRACACAAEKMTSSLSAGQLEKVNSDASLTIAVVRPYVESCVQSELPNFLESNPGFLREYVLKHPEILDQL